MTATHATTNPTEAIARAKQGEARGFDELVDLYSSRLYGFLLRLTGHRDDAEDLVQEVFVRVVRTIERYEDDGRFEAWLFRIATNLVRDRIRKIRREPPTKGLSGGAPGSAVDESESEALLPPAEVDGPDHAVNSRDTLGRLEECLGRLPQAEREVILLRHYTDLSFAQIAEMMGTPLGTALARSHRGLAKLRAWMESDE